MSFNGKFFIAIFLFVGRHNNNDEKYTKPLCDNKDFLGSFGWQFPLK